MTVEDFPSRIPKSAGDVMLVIKRWMGDASAAQVIALVPASRISTIMGGVIGLQPTGIAPRRHIAQAVVNNVENEVPKMLAQKFISLDAAAYLTSYVRGTLDLPPRPREYAFLRHRWNKSSEHGSSGGLVQYNGDEVLRGVIVRQTDGKAPPATADDGDDIAVPVTLVPRG